jgi:hypothetical protein
MFELNRVKPYLREHPQEAAWPHVRSARQLLMDMFRPHPETERALQFLRTFRAEGERAAWHTFEQRTGVRPDPLLRVRLRPELGAPGQVIVPYLGRLFDEHRQRLSRNRQAARVPERAQAVQRSLRMPPGLVVWAEATSQEATAHPWWGRLFEG